MHLSSSNNKNFKNINRDTYIKTISIRSICTRDTYASKTIGIRDIFFT